MNNEFISKRPDLFQVVCFDKLLFFAIQRYMHLFGVYFQSSPFIELIQSR